MGKLIMKAHPETGVLGTEATLSNGNKGAWVRVEQSTVQINNGFIEERKRVAFAFVPDALKAQILDGKKDGDEFPLEGKIVIKEALQPFYEGQEPKRAGEDGGICVKNGRPIYRQIVFTSNMAEEDELIPHDAIVESLASLEATQDTNSAEEL